MTEILTDLSLPNLVYAVEANSWAFFKLLTGWEPAETHNAPDLIWVLTDYPSPIFNNVVFSHVSIDQVDGLVEEMKGRARQRGVPMQWQVGPAESPPELGRRLLAHGFSLEERVPGMVLDLDRLEYQPLLPGVKIEQVHDPASLEAFIAAFSTGFEVPDFVAGAFTDFFHFHSNREILNGFNYLLWDNGQPVAVSSMVLGGGVAGIYNVATVPSARGRGFGSAITAFPLLEARRLGYRAAILHASVMGEPVYRRLGFQIVCHLDHCVWIP